MLTPPSKWSVNTNLSTPKTGLSPIVASIKPNKPDSSPLTTDLESMVAIMVIPKMAIQNNSVVPNSNDKRASGGVKNIRIKTPKIPPTKELIKQ